MQNLKNETIDAEIAYRSELLDSIPGNVIVYSAGDGNLVREYSQINLEEDNLPEFASLIALGQYVHSKSLRDFGYFLNEFLEGKSEPKSIKVELEIRQGDSRRIVDVFMVNQIIRERLVVYILNSSTKATRQLIDDKTNKRLYVGTAKLTQREILVLRHIADGKKTSEIAEATERSIYTIENTKRRLFRKLNLKNVNELVRFATEYDIV